MSRHNQRFERDFRGAWERRERCASLVGSAAAVSSSSNNNNGLANGCAGGGVPVPSGGNNRPGLLPLPVIPSLLPTPVTVATTTSSSEMVCKRLIPAPTTSSSKVISERVRERK